MTSVSSISPEKEKRIAAQVSSVGIIGNVLLSVFKLIAGIIGHSGAMISDSIHSMSDVFATAIAYIGVRTSRKVADKEHPYGHERVECVASLILGISLFVVGCGIGLDGIKKITAGSYDTLAIPSAIALVAAITSIVVKEAMYWYTRYYAKILNSTAFMADAWHHRSDALSSIGSLIGIGGAMLGFPVLDPIACVVICLCIFKVAYDTVKDALVKMLDTSCGEETEKAIAGYIESQEGVVQLTLLHTRLFGSKVYVDAEVSMDGNKTLNEAHAVAERIHDGVEEQFPNIKHIMIHVNPAQ